MNTEQTQEILSLRDKKLTPKQIARKLGLKVSEVKAVVIAQAEQQAVIKAEKGELDPIVDCFVNADCVEALLQPGEDEAGESVGGMALVVVVRSPKPNRYLVATYLVDYWCLGLKDTITPRLLNSDKYFNMLQNVYAAFPTPATKISLPQAQAIVYGAVAYAKELGFDPHPDFAQSQPHLGEWDGQPQLEFGREGKPFYMSGPYDKPETIIATLRENVGEGNFEYVMGLGDSDGFMDLDPGLFLQ